jgi:hypothetical protein
MTGNRIGILTFHRCINYGSFWQAKNLVEGLQKNGYDAILIDHYSPTINHAEWKCALQPVFPVVKEDQKLYRKKIEYFFKAFETLPMTEPVPLNNSFQIDDFDTVVVGSDEVWNLIHPWYGKTSLFFGENIKAPNIVSYAASFGNYPAAWGLEDSWSEKLNNFSQVSVRDENSRILVENATSIQPSMVLDPWLNFRIEERPDHPWKDKNYIALYGHHFSPSYIYKIRQYANSRQLPLVSIGYSNPWADHNWISAGPYEFASFIAGANSVVTNFFHGCIASLVYKKPFVCESSDYRSFKVKGLMKKLGTMSHLVTEDTNFNVVCNSLDHPIKKEVFYKIAELRNSSNAFLEKALNYKQKKCA